MRLHLCLAAALLFSASIAAHADDLFTLTDGSNTVSFTLPATTTPDGATLSANGYYFNSVPVTADGTTTSESVTFYLGADGGALSIQDAGQGAFGDGGSGVLVDTFGDQLFTGGLSGLTFTLGDYAVNSNDVGVYDNISNLSITSTSATPEPSSLMLLGTGLLGLAETARRRLRA